MATLKSVSKEIMSDLAKTSLIARKVASDMTTLTRKRIFTDGIGSNGIKLGTYAQTTIRTKKKKGRFTSSSVNIRDSERLVNSYSFACQGKKCELGFLSINRGDGNTNQEVIKSIEEQYGEVFELTASESKEIDNIIGDFIDKLF